MATPGLDDAANSPSFSAKQLTYLASALLALVLAVVAIWPSMARLVISSSYLPHLYCYLGNSTLIWTNAAADAAIGISYLAISATLAYLVFASRQHIPFGWLFLAFGVFIVACGFTHFMEVVTLWIPIYTVSVAIKVFTASSSVLTAAVFPFTVPRIRSLLRNAILSDRPRELLADALRDRDFAKSSLEDNNRALELKVRERTAEL